MVTHTVVALGLLLTVTVHGAEILSESKTVSSACVWWLRRPLCTGSLRPSALVLKIYCLFLRQLGLRPSYALSSPEVCLPVFLHCPQAMGWRLRVSGHQKSGKVRNQARQHQRSSRLTSTNWLLISLTFILIRLTLPLQTGVYVLHALEHILLFCPFLRLWSTLWAWFWPRRYRWRLLFLFMISCHFHTMLMQKC